MLKLKSIGILITVTIRANRIAGCPLLSEKDLKKNDCGSVSFKCDINSGLTIVQWYDNKCVQVASTCSTAESSGTVKRWDPKSKTYL